MNKRPLSVTLVGWLFIAAGIVGIAYHATEFNASDPFGYDLLLALGVRILAIVGGAFALRGANWARWLLLVWLAYHVSPQCLPHTASVDSARCAHGGGYLCSLSTAGIGVFSGCEGNIRTTDGLSPAKHSQHTWSQRVLVVLLLASGSLQQVHSQVPGVPDTVSVRSDSLTLKGLLWRPSGSGVYPAIIFCHGSYGGSDTVHDPLQQASLLGPVFARQGYMFLALFRRGVGLSTGQGVNSADLMERVLKEKGNAERSRVQLQQLEGPQLHDMIAGLAYLRGRHDVDTARIAVVGHSFGGSLAILLAGRVRELRAVVVFAAAGYSWDRSPELRTRLLDALSCITAPVMLIHAANDYSIHPGQAMDSVMTRLRRPHALKIYPAIGTSVNDGHNLIFESMETWKADVFAFLDQALRR